MPEPTLSWLIHRRRWAKPDRTTATPSDYAARAARAYAAMQSRFRTRDGQYRSDSKLHPPGSVAHLWPFSRALVASLDLAGIQQGLIGDFDADAAIADRLLAQYDTHSVWVKASKPEPPLALPVSEVSVELWREAE